MMDRRSRGWWARSVWWCGGLAMSLMSSGATAEPSGPIVGALGELSDRDRQVLVEVLQQAGLKQVKARSVERTPERQVRVMLNLAEEDLDGAKSMYCDAGDEILAQFDPKATREKNQSVMLQALVSVLPKAREMGCLNHVRNDDVVSIDVAADDVPASRHAALTKAAEAAVAAKKLERFLAPPREPQAFHFEFKRRADVKSEKPTDNAKRGPATTK
jgi:hypothetical protein